jgi:DNA-binding transcriptional MerR regulator
LALLAVTNAAIPNRPVFRAQEVCELAQVQPYVLRSWEAEFPDLGVSKKTGDARVYRRADVERVLQLRHLLFVDGLTLAGARKRLGLTTSPVPAVVPERERARAVGRDRGRDRDEDTAGGADADVAAFLDDEARQNLRDVRRGLQWVLGVLAGGGVTSEDRLLVLSRKPSRTKSRTNGRARKSARVTARRPVRKVAKLKMKIRKGTKGKKR